MTAQPVRLPIRPTGSARHRRRASDDDAPNSTSPTAPGPAQLALSDHPAGTGGEIVHIADRVDPRLAQALRQRRPVLLVSRVSTETGAQAVIQMVNGLWEAAEYLADYGIDTRPALSRLPKPALIERFAAEATSIQTRDGDTGRPFTNRVLVVTDFLPDGLLLWLSCGSARKTDDQYNQPAVKHLVFEAIKAHNPALVYAAELTRMARSPLATQLLVQALQDQIRHRHSPVFAGDKSLSVSLVDDQFEERAWRASQASKRELEQLRRRHLGGQRQRFDEIMKHGQVAYAHNAAAWPGMATARLRQTSRTSPRRILYIDSPEFRPDPAIVRAGDDPTMLPDGSPAVDQATLVCWAFDHLFTPGMDRREVAAHLRAHGYATQSLRRLHHTAWPDQPAPSTPRAAMMRDRNLLRPLLDHLDEYRTGVFTVTLPDGAGTRHIENVFPGRGYWMDADSYTRIATVLASPRNASRGNRPFVFSGLPVTLNGRPAVLEAHIRGHDEPHYHPVLVHRRGQGRSNRATPTPPIPHHTLITAIATALGTPGTPLPRLPEPERPTSTAAQKVSDLTRQIADLHEHRDNIQGFIEIGRSKPANTHLRERFDELTDQIGTLTASLADAERVLARLEGHQRLGLEDTEILTLIRGLRDTRSPHTRRLLRESLANVAVHVTRNPHPGGLVWWDAAITATLRIHNDTATYELPIVGELHGGPAVRMSRRITEAVTRLYDGIPLAESIGQDWLRWIPVVRASLGVADHDQLLITRITDTRLLRLVMAVRHPRLPQPARTDVPGVPLLAGPTVSATALPALADRLDEPVRLLERIATVYAPRDRRQFCWLNENSAVVARAFLAARRRGLCSAATATRAVLRTGPFGSEWTSDRDGGSRLRPCEHCGGTNRIPLRLREAIGSVCRQCRADRNTVPWPPTYDVYRHVGTHG